MTVTIKQKKIREYLIEVEAEKEGGFAVLLSYKPSINDDYYITINHLTYPTQEKAMARFYDLCRKYR